MSKIAEAKFKGKAIFGELIESAFKTALDKIEDVKSSNIKNGQIDVGLYSKGKVDMNQYQDVLGALLLSQLNGLGSEYLVFDNKLQVRPDDQMKKTFEPFLKARLAYSHETKVKNYEGQAKAKLTKTQHDEKEALKRKKKDLSLI
jgi:hypothetical protein